MQFIELRDNIINGFHPHVKFNKDIQTLEGYLDPGMIAIITNIQDIRIDHFGIVFDVSQYHEYNAQFEQPNYYDQNNNPTLTASQAGYRPEKNEIYYFMNSDMVEQFFDFIDSDSLKLFNEYLTNHTSNQSYVTWLEETIINTRKSPIS